MEVKPLIDQTPAYFKFREFLPGGDVRRKSPDGKIRQNRTWATSPMACSWAMCAWLGHTSAGSASMSITPPATMIQPKRSES
jgi:hypothetical protein